MAIIDDLNTLQSNIVTVKQVLADNINTKGVSTVTSANTLTQLANAVNDITVGEGGGSSGDNSFSVIGYTSTPQYIQDGINHGKEIYDNWDDSITDRYRAFYGDIKLIYFPKVNTSNVTNMGSMFTSCTNLENVPSFDTSKVTNMDSMFSGCKNLTTLDVSGWDTSNVTNMGSMFNNCSGLTELDLSSFDTSNVTDMGQMFYGSSFISLKLNGWDLKSLKPSLNYGPLYSMFSDCTNLTTLDVSGWKTSNITDMSYMFNNCYSLSSLDLTSFDTSKVTNMGSMFSGCKNLTTLDVSGWDTSNVTNMGSMFNNCSSLSSLDLTSFDTSKVTNMSYIFNSCSKLKKINGYLDFTSLTSFINFLTFNGGSLKYFTIKNLGSKLSNYNFNNANYSGWGDETDTTTYPLSIGARQSLVDSLLTYSYDRVSNGLSTCTIQLYSTTKARLTEDEIAQITAKGFTIA